MRVKLCNKAFDLSLAGYVSLSGEVILDKHHQKKKPWVTAEILDLCDKRRELRKNRCGHEGSEKYKEVINNI